MQLGTAANTAPRHSSIAAGLPGRLMISVRPRLPASCRERIAVGTDCKDTARICSPNPGYKRSHTALVASGVTSRGDGPVPPVVTTSAHPVSSTSSRSVASICGCSSGMTRRTGCQSRSQRVSTSWMAGPERSSYSPELARSETVTIPIGVGIPQGSTENGAPDTGAPLCVFRTGWTFSAPACPCNRVHFPDRVRQSSQLSAMVVSNPKDAARTCWRSALHRCRRVWGRPTPQ